MAIDDEFLDDALLLLDARRAGNQIGIRAFQRLAFVLAIHVASFITTAALPWRDCLSKTAASRLGVAAHASG